MSTGAIHTKLKVKHAGMTQTGATNNTEIFRTSLKIEDIDNNSDTALALDTWARAFVNLSTDEYRSVDITATAELAEIITNQQEG